MPDDIVEMLWGCLSCKAENRGRFKECQGCGAPRSPQSPEWMPGDISHAAAVTDDKLLAKFEAGPDWKCRYCGSSQYRADGCCAQCGSAQGESVAATVASPWAEEAISSDEKLGREIAEGMYRDARPTEPPDPPPLEPSVPIVAKMAWRPPVWAFIAAGATVVLALVLFFLLRTKEVDVTVASIAWTKAVKVERYQAWRREGWDPDRGALHVTDLGRRIHHYDRVRIGSHEEHTTVKVKCGEDCTHPSCYTTPRNCTSNKNGSAKCSGGDRVCPDEVCTDRTCDEPRTETVDDYEQQPRYRDWYAWDVWDWGYNRTVSTGGTTTETYWPTNSQIGLDSNVSGGEREREAGRVETFSVTLRAKADYKYQPKSDADFQRFSVGSAHRIKVGITHGVEVLR